MPPGRRERQGRDGKIAALWVDATRSPAALAPCLLAALHAPDEHQGIPAHVGAMALARALIDLSTLRSALTKDA